MTNIETISSVGAMKLALEALETMQNAIYNIGGEHVTDLGYAVEKADVAEQAITSLRQAINAAEQREQAQQAEPVAIVDSTITGHIDWLCTFFPKQGTKLYTSSPQRQWVGLTDEDAQEVIEQAMQTITGGSNTFTLSANSVWLAITRAIEAKLKAKNSL